MRGDQDLIGNHRRGVVEIKSESSEGIKIDRVYVALLLCRHEREQGLGNRDGSRGCSLSPSESAGW